MTYAETFIALSTEWEALELVDEAINAARNVAPHNGHLQLELDRRQTDANHQRARIVEFVAISAILN